MLSHADRTNVTTPCKLSLFLSVVRSICSWLWIKHNIMREDQNSALWQSKLLDAAHHYEDFGLHHTFFSFK